MWISKLNPVFEKEIQDYSNRLDKENNISSPFLSGNSLFKYHKYYQRYKRYKLPEKAIVTGGSSLIYYFCGHK